MTEPTIAFIGGGNMAGSLIGGLLEHGHPTDKLVASAPSASTRQRLTGQFDIQCHADNGAASATADIIILAVKPQMMREVCQTLADNLDHNPLIISVAAGITTEQVDRWLGGHRAILRCMPNTPAMLHCGASGLYANPQADSVQRQLGQQIFEAVGAVEWIDSEQLMDAVTAVSGSGPAYYFLIMELMEKIGAELGLSPQTARNLTIQTALGAARMAAEGELDPAELRRRVTSPNGTTDRAITTFLNSDLEAIIRSGMTGARDRGREMAREINQ